MKAADIEWSMLRGALIALGIAVVVSGALIGASYHFWEGGAKDLRRAQSALRAARGKYRTVDEQEAMIATFYPQFLELESDGIVGSERRLDWIENLRRADEHLKLPSLSYSIDTRAPFTAEYPLAGGAYQPFASDMSLTIGMLHSEDLFRLLAALDETAQGLYSVDSCSLIRAKETVGSPREAHVNTTCRLRWFTIKKPGDEEAAS